jgi:hypothetical protein
LATIGVFLVFVYSYYLIYSRSYLEDNNIISFEKNSLIKEDNLDEPFVNPFNNL